MFRSHLPRPAMTTFQAPGSGVVVAPSCFHEFLSKLQVQWVSIDLSYGRSGLLFVFVEWPANSGEREVGVSTGSRSIK